MPGFDYFRAADTEQFAFYRIPKALFTDKTFGKLSCEAKVLYGLMLDRICLSIRNNWIDDDGHAYIIFQSDEISELMGCGRQKTFRLLAELDTDGGIGLIERCRRGQGKVSIIYVRNFNSSSGEPGGRGDHVEQSMTDCQPGDSRETDNGQSEDRQTTAAGWSMDGIRQDQVSTANSAVGFYEASTGPEIAQHMPDHETEPDHHEDRSMPDSYAGQHKDGRYEGDASDQTRPMYRSGTLAFSENDLLGIPVREQETDKEVMKAPSPDREPYIKPGDPADIQKYEIHTSRSMENNTEEEPDIQKYENHTSRSMKNDTGEVPDIQKYENHTSRNMKIILPEVRKSYANDTESTSKTESSKTEFLSSPLSSPRDSGDKLRTGGHKDEIGEEGMLWTATRETVKDQIGYDALCPEYGHERVDQIVEIMTDMLASKRKSVMISGVRLPADVVKGVFRKLNMFHIQYVFECLDDTETRIKNIRRYLIATLYNAPSTMTEYYRNRIRADQAAYYNRSRTDRAV